jgi:ABC-type branched-subunit amino acid transport system ATPase component
MELLEHLGLQDRSNVAATSISSGQQKLMDMARALAMNPSTLLMDEPLAALSRENQLVVLDAARRLADAGGTVLIVEHILSSLLDYAERLMVVDRGALIADGKPREVVQATHVVDAYLGSATRVVSEVGK